MARSKSESSAYHGRSAVGGPRLAGRVALGGAVLRLSSETAVSFLNLTDEAVQIQVAQGSASLRVRHLEDNETLRD